MEFPDTDAAGHHQMIAVMRWALAAEAELHDRLGIADRTFGHTPRVHFEVDFLERLWFLDRIDVELRVVHVGRSSLRYAFEVRRGEAAAARGWFAVAYVPREVGAIQPWPEALRTAFRTGGLR